MEHFKAVRSIVVDKQRENSNIVFHLFERSPVGFLVGIVFFCLILFLLGVLMKYQNS